MNSADSFSHLKKSREPRKLIDNEFNLSDNNNNNNNKKYLSELKTEFIESF